MKNETSAAIFRRKNFHEAADTGILLWRENFVYFLPLFAIPLWVCAFSSRILLPENFQIYSWLIIWFLKPLFDRIALHIISIRFFERDANLKRVTKGLWKTFFRGLIGDLSWRRFSPMRSSIMPIRVLEKNLKPGKSILKRKNHLKNGGIDYSFFLTIWGLFIEAALLLGEFLFFMAINELMLNGKIDLFNFAGIEIYLFAAWCFNIILIETIYVCMGFSLYINSRITVEGWDLEIIFKNFAMKIKEKAKNAAVIILLITCLFMPQLSHADDIPYETSQEIPLQELQKILEDQDFGGKKESWGIRLKKEPDEKEKTNFNYDKLLTFFEKLREFFASGLRILLICIITVLLVVLIIYARKMKLRKRENYHQPAENILKTKTIEDPKILLDKAINFNSHGDIRLAWGYCTAAAIQSWQVYKGIVFPVNATENDCANIINLKASDKTEVTTEMADTFKILIKNWVYFAYAGKFPPDGSFDEAVNFCVSIRNKNG